MLGLIENRSNIVTASFKNDGDVIILLGESNGHVGGTEYLKCVHGLVVGNAPALDLDTEKRLHEVCLLAIERRLVNSAHDCSEGGLAVALAECCIMNREKSIGCTIDLTSSAIRPDFLLFGEDQSRILISITSEKRSAIENLAADKGVPMKILGRVGGPSMVIEGRLVIDIKDLRQSYESLSIEMEEEKGYNFT